jgi:hypothetical protein
MSVEGQTSLSDDLLQGIRAIAEFTGFPERQVFYLAEKQRLPLFKIGSRWCARRSTLLAYIANLEKAAVVRDVA